MEIWLVERNNFPPLQFCCWWFREFSDHDVNVNDVYASSSIFLCQVVLDDCEAFRKRTNDAEQLVDSLAIEWNSYIHEINKQRLKVDR